MSEWRILKAFFKRETWNILISSELFKFFCSVIFWYSDWVKDSMKNSKHFKLRNDLIKIRSDFFCNKKKKLTSGLFFIFKLSIINFFKSGLLVFIKYFTIPISSASKYYEFSLIKTLKIKKIKKMINY